MSKTSSTLHKTADYQQWLNGLKQDFQRAQIKASIKVNSTLLAFYWQLGSDIIEKQKSTTWGQGFLSQLSQDLMADFPAVKGFSKRNLELIRYWCDFWNTDKPIAKQLVSQLTQVPWGHNVLIARQSQSKEEALYYISNTQQHGWSRSVLVHQIESKLWQREGKAISNFESTLPALHSDLAQQTLKDPYLFDFLSLTKDYNERELEQGLIEHISQFLLELGAGFAYIGKQVHLAVGQQDFYIDLLFYHVKLHSYVVIELKNTAYLEIKSKPEYAGKLSFYITAVDEQLKNQHDGPTIGILLCKGKDKLVAEYALRDINKPIGVSEYQLTQALPDNLKSSLPSIEEIESEFAND
ncbi:MAG: PDDEXK nuclease domain-containing protein [Cycloclasticus sp.]